MMKRILLIGHDPRVCHSVSCTLNGLGFGVDVAYDSRTGLFLAGRREYSHVLVDHEIDGAGGIRLFERLRLAQRGAVGVLFTAAGNINTVFSAVNAGMRRVLTKPVDFSQLLPLLNSTATVDSRKVPTMTEIQIAELSQHDIREQMSVADLIDIIRSVDYPFAGKERLDHFDRDTLERVVHLVCRWCRQRNAEAVV